MEKGDLGCPWSDDDEYDDCANNACAVNGKLSANHKSHPKDMRDNTPPTRGIPLCLTSLCKTPS